MSVSRMSEQSSLLGSDATTHQQLDLFDVLGLEDTVAQFSLQEQQILSLYDRLKALQLEMKLLEAQRKAATDPTMSRADLDLDLDVAEREALEAKAKYSLRSRIVENVISVESYLNTINSSTDITPAEQTLKQYLRRRDFLSMAHANISSTLSSTSESLASAQVENMVLTKENQDLVKELLTLTGELKEQGKMDINDGRLKSQLEGLEEENITLRQKWIMMKSIVASVIAGSGVEWASDAELRKLVIDLDEEDLG
ncbi:MAG: hypothetical protein M1834_002103 [Cirrosporium novae-zelandiae]|nr:MAG: hypothetical protein M1834_002103 [Cirrosporium novae-zelandiae]